MVTNCFVRGFNVGIGLYGASQVTVMESSASGNVTGFLVAEGSTDSLLVGNTAERNVNEGFKVIGSRANTLQDNEVTGGRQGYLLESAHANDLAGNRVVGARDWFGFGFISGSRENMVTDNYAENSGSGFAVQLGARSNVFGGNEAVDNAIGFNVLDTAGGQNEFTTNVARGNRTGFFDLTRADGDAGTANSYSENVCGANEVTAEPLGLCG